MAAVCDIQRVEKSITGTNLMDPDKPPQSPFAPGWSPDASTEPVPDQPRLGIIHFLVWMTCVAVCLGITRAWWGIQIADRASGPQSILIYLGLLDIGSGAALGGLALWMTRRLRGWTFPRYPGEYLLAVLGVTVLLSLAMYITDLVLASFDEGGAGHAKSIVFDGYGQFAQGLIRGLFLLWAVVCVKVPRWRLFFFGVLATGLLPSFCVFWLMGLMGPNRVLYFVLSVWLIALVITDHFQGRRYPWTHWLGVAVYLWYEAVAAGWALWQSFAANVLR